MTQNKTDTRQGGPRNFSRWFQRKMNARTNARIRRKGGSMMGMEVLILHTLGRTSSEPRETPVAWFADGDDSRLVIASGGGERHPDWYSNLMAHPERAAIELPGSAPVAVTPERLEGPDRAAAWDQIASAQPRIAKYQRKSEREYPVVRLRAVTKEAG